MDQKNIFEQQPKVSRFKELINSTDPLTLGKVLDIETDPVSGDTILTAKMIKQYSDTTLTTAIERWSSYAVSLDENDAKDRAHYDVAQSRINDLNLGRLLYQQVLGEVDQSESIRQMEALIYEHYSPALYRAALKQKIQLLEGIIIDNPDLVVARADLIDELESFLSSTEKSSEKLEQPEFETLSVVSDWLRTKYGENIQAVDEIKVEQLTAFQLNEIFGVAIKETPALRKTGWTSSVIERNKNAVSTFSGKREIVISSQRIVTKKVAKGLVVHEVFGHALRAANAEQLGNEVGAIGTATYSTFEESFMIALEQCLNNAYDPERGLNHYIARGLVVTDNQPRDKIIQIFASIKQIEESVGGLKPDAISQADILAVKLLSRTFAGMTDVDPGIAHLQDINYLHGLNGAWKILNHLVHFDELEEGMDWLLSAKFNPFNENDRELINSFTPMPSSLESFFKDEAVKAL